MNNLETELFNAVNSGNEYAHNDVDDLIRRGVNLNCTNNMGQNALHYALLKMSLFRMKNYPVVEFLIKTKININLQDNNGDTPLHMAARSNLPNIADQLMAAGANVTLLNKLGQAPMHVCLGFGNNSLECAKIIMKDSRALKTTMPNGFSLLHQALATKNIDFIKEVINAFKDVNVRTADGYAPVHAAVITGNLPALEELVKAGAELSVADKEGKYPVHIAASRNSANILSYLTDNFPCINQSDANGNPPLYHAITNHNIWNTSYLIQKGADVAFLNKLGQNLIISLFFDDKDGKSLRYTDVGIDKNHLQWKELIGQLLNKGIDVNDSPIDGLPPAWGAFMSGLYDIFYYLVERGANINCHDSNGSSFLIEAVKNKNLELVNYIISKGIDVNKKDISGHYAFFYAAETNNQEMIDLLNSNKNLVKDEVKLDNLEFDDAFSEIQKLINQHTFVEKYPDFSYPIVAYSAFVADLAKWDMKDSHNFKGGVGVESIEYFTPRYTLKLTAVRQHEEAGYNVKQAITEINLSEQKTGGCSKGFNIKET